MYDINGKELSVGAKVRFYDPDIENRDLSRIFTIDNLKGDFVQCSDEYSDLEAFPHELEIVT